MQKTALILHGWPDFNMKFHTLSEHLKDVGYKVLIPNLFDFDKKFNLSETAENVKKMLKKSSPDVIIGISFGGFVLPEIAKSYPNAKLVFIATGPYFKPDSNIFEIFLKVSKYKLSIILGNKLLNLPDAIIKFIYKNVYLYKGDKEAQAIYQNDMVRNIRYIKKISMERNVEVLNFINTVDNSDLLKTLKNRSLIFVSKNDYFMPFEVGVSLNKLLNNSQIIIKDGEHFNVFTNKDLKIVDDFVNSK